jgi:hypothetical protein
LYILIDELDICRIDLDVFKSNFEHFDLIERPRVKFILIFVQFFHSKVFCILNSSCQSTQIDAILSELFADRLYIVSLIQNEYRTFESQSFLIRPYFFVEKIVVGYKNDVGNGLRISLIVERTKGLQFSF